MKNLLKLSLIHTIFERAWEASTYFRRAQLSCRIKALDIGNGTKLAKWPRAQFRISKGGRSNFMADYYLDIVNEKDEVVGKELKSRTLEKGFISRVAAIYLCDSDGKF